jgi:AcrR family transcriptional regulator
MTNDHKWKKTSAQQDSFGPEERKPEIGRRQRRREETREKIYQAALSLFAESGYNATTIEAITEAADVGKGTFFNYFESKGHVLLRFRDKRINIIQSFLNENRMLGVPLTSVFNNLAIALTREFGMNAALFQSFIIAAFTNEAVRSQMSEGLAKGRELISDHIAQRQQRGEIRDDLRSHDIAYDFQRIVFGTLVLWSMNPATLLKNELENMVEILISGIRTGAGISTAKNGFRRRTRRPNTD